MIGWLSGELLDSSENPVLLDVNGVGYEIELPVNYWENLSSFILKSKPGSNNLNLCIHSHYREDSHQLFGFFEAVQKKLFRELIRVSGVGAKSALMILSTFEVGEFVNIIQENDIKSLTQVPGIGKKSAERLLIECQDRILKTNFYSPISDKSNLSENIAISGDITNNNSRNENGVDINGSSVLSNKFSVISDATEALSTLGYKPQDSRMYAKKHYKDNMSTEQLIKAVLHALKCSI